MKKTLMLGAMALLLAGCQTAREQYAATGALIGGTTGAVVGAASSGTGGAVVGGAVGAVAGALVGAAVAPPDYCYVRTKRGRVRAVPC